MILPLKVSTSEQLVVFFLPKSSIISSNELIDIVSTAKTKIIIKTIYTRFEDNLDLILITN